MVREFGPYRLDALIGEGGMGQVHRAFDPRLNRPVAIKVMRDETQTHALERFLREARAASALNHPNIVTIHEIGQTAAGEHFIVQELIDGRTLRELIASGLPIDAVLGIGEQVASALAAAHAAGIVHRDVKPENIMVRRDGYVKVLDFGLARVAPPEADTTEMTVRQITAVGTVVGTVSYMSPEQAQAGIAGPASDVFALGIVLYEMAAGHRPFAAATHVGLLAAIVSEQPVSLVRLNPATPAAFDALVFRMLAKDSARRPSAAEVRAALGGLQRQEARVVPAPGPVAQRRTVGRERERAALRRAYARITSGPGLLLAVTGEAGIGKTSLVDDFLAELAAGAARTIVTRGRCAEQLAGSEAYLPLLEALDGVLHRGAAGSLDAVMRTVAPTWYVQVSARGSDDDAGLESGRRPAASQERMKRELGAFFEEASRAHPVVVVIEDLHWADISTIDMLNYLAGRFDAMRVLVLATYRSAEMAVTQHPFLRIRPDLQARGAFEELPLDFLEQADVERYLSLEFPGHAFPATFASMVYGKTEGNPLFMADLVRYLRDAGGLVQESGRWVLARSPGDLPRDLPASVRAMITRKIERLDETDRRLLLAASVQGHEFDSATLAEAAEMDPGDVEERLDALERVHVFVKRGEEVEFPDRTLTLTYQFVHVLYQNVLHATLQPTRRAALSGRVARALVARHGSETGSTAGRLGLLFEAARDFAASAQYFYAAAQHATALFAFREALSLAERGLGALRTLSDDARRRQLELGLQMVKGVALRSTSGWATTELERTFARARRLCQELGDPPQVFPVLWAITLFHLIRGNLPECRAHADELMVKAAATATPAFMMAAHHMAGVSREFLGEMADSARLLERARALHDPAEHAAYTAMYGIDPGVLARAMHSRSVWALGYQDRALGLARETLAIAETGRVPLTHVFALMVLGGILAYRGDGDESVRVSDASIALCREHGLPQEAEWSRSFQGFAMITLGRIDEGTAQLLDSLSIQQQQLKTNLARPMFLALVAIGLHRAGRIDEGLRIVDEGLDWAGRTSEGGYVAELHRVRGELLHLAGDAGAAEASLRTALADAAARGTKSFELRAATALARLLHAAGRTKEARAVLAPVYGWFMEGHATMDLRAAASALAELG